MGYVRWGGVTQLALCPTMLELFTMFLSKPLIASSILMTMVVLLY